MLDPGRGKTKTGYLWAVLCDDRGWNGSAPPGVVFHYRPGRKGEYAAEILDGFNGTIQVDAYGGGYSHLATLDRVGGDPLKLDFCWAHGRRKLIKATPKSGSPIVDEALVRIAALYKIEDSIRGSDPEHRRAVRQDLSLPLVDAQTDNLGDPPCPARIRGSNRRQSVGERLSFTFLMRTPPAAQPKLHRCGFALDRQILEASVGPAMPISGPPSAIRANAELWPGS